MEALERKVVVLLALLTEKVNDGLSAELEYRPTDNANDKTRDDSAQVGGLDTLKVSGAVVVADDGLAADAETDHDADDYGVYLHDDTLRRKGNIGAVNALSTVLCKEIVHADDDDGGGKLRKEA